MDHTFYHTVSFLAASLLSPLSLLPPSLPPFLLPSLPLQVFKEIKRQSHITAEQRRRGTIKQGFDQLQTIVVDPSSYPSGKVSKATVLEKSQSLIFFLLYFLKMSPKCSETVYIGERDFLRVSQFAGFFSCAYL